ncbi:hypothetical protein [Bdellovibrio sp. HCB209]|uniref:hypothetical protein n=1 Tax=Bdellovibrio sp. HCB209 TaxID=3394354 RepID=UPI0039B4D453
MVEWLVQKMESYWVAWIIGFQIILNVLGVALIFGIAVYRKGTVHEAKVLLPKLQERVTDICVGMNTDTSDLKKLKNRHRVVVRGLILKALDSVSGSYRENLVRLYAEMGFLAEDRSLLESKSFAKRLAALSRIDVLQDMDSGKKVGQMLNDPSPFVHFAALKFLLKLRFPKLYVNINRELDRLLAIDRMDTAAQILEMYAKGYTEDFLDLLRTHQNRQVISMCLEVVLRLQIVEAIPIVKDQLIDSLRSADHEDLTGFDFRRYTLCLTVAPDEETEDILQKMTELDNPSIRNFAYLALLKVRPDLKAEMIDRLSFDESVFGQRLYRQLLEPGLVKKDVA